MTHDSHTTLPGYDERQILFDGCRECEARGEDPPLALRLMSVSEWKRLNDRVRLWRKDAFGVIGIPSGAELGLMRVIEAVQLMQEREAREVS